MHFLLPSISHHLLLRLRQILYLAQISAVAAADAVYMPGVCAGADVQG